MLKETQKMLFLSSKKLLISETKKKTKGFLGFGNRKFPKPLNITLYCKIYNTNILNNNSWGLHNEQQGNI